MCVCSMLMWTDHGTILDIFVYRMASPISVIDSLCYMVDLDMCTYRLYTYAPRLIVNSFILKRTIFIVNRISNGYCNILYIVNEVSFCVHNYMDNYYYYVTRSIFYHTLTYIHLECFEARSRYGFETKIKIMECLCRLVCTKLWRRGLVG